MTYRLETRTVALADVDWQLGDAPWRLPDDRSDAMLQLVEPSADLASTFVPSSAPLPLQSIDGAPIARGIGLPWMRWTTINERGGAFRERFAPGAFSDALDRGDGLQIPPLLNHGQDPVAGVKPLGRLEMWQASDGLRFELAFLPVDYARDVAAGIREGLYGASVRFATKADRVKRNPGRSAENPTGIEERTITRAHLVELSMTPLPAYKGTSAVLMA